MSDLLDILIVNASVIDGTGRPAFSGAVGVKDGRIALVCEGACARPAKRVIDACGRVCCPGFVDIHSHADVSLPLSPGCYSLLVQGVTTFVGGNCGIGNAPMPREDYRRQYTAYNHLEEIDFTWKTFSEWLAAMERLGVAANYVPLVPHNSIRGGVLGCDWARPSAPEEIEAEQALLTEALDAGAFGMSLSFDAGVPGHHASPEEINALLALLQRRDSLVTAHTRHHQNQWPSGDGRTYYGIYNGWPGEVITGRYHGLKEFSDYAVQYPGLRFLFSHLTSSYIVPQPHSQTLENALVDESLRELIDEPVAQGADLYFDLLPDEWSLASECRVTDNLTRSMVFDGEFAAQADEKRIVEALKDPAFRQRYKKFFNSGRLKIGMVVPATDPYWSDTYVFQRCRDKDVVGKTLLELTRQRAPGRITDMIYENCLDVLFDVVVSDPDVTWALCRDKREYMAAERLLCHGRGVPMTDSPVFDETVPAGRNIMGYGCPPNAYTMFPVFLLRMVRKSGLLTLEQAIHKITGLPAQIMRLAGRGVLREGAWADVVIFDWEGMEVPRSFTDPTARATGFDTVLVNGVPAMEHGRLTGGRAGRVLRRGAAADC